MSTILIKTTKLTRNMNKSREDENLSLKFNYWEKKTFAQYSNYF